VKISNKKFSFFSSLNQYFPHIPYVASKKAGKKHFGKSSSTKFLYPLEESMFKKLAKSEMVTGQLGRFLQKTAPNKKLSENPRWQIKF
jgi:hypothetical protein